jgi:hypothetical protein
LLSSARIVLSVAALIAGEAAAQPAAPAQAVSGRAPLASGSAPSALPDPAVQRNEEWLTIHGFPELGESDLVQINPTVMPWQEKVAVEVRVSRSSLRTNQRNVSYQSYEGMAVFDCVQRKGSYLSLRYYQEPNWKGPVTARAEFKEHDAPVVFAGIPGDPAGKLIRAACRAR